MQNIKLDAVQATHAGTFQGPNGIFGLIDDAAKVYGYIQQQAAGQFAGALSLLGAGVSVGFSAFSQKGSD